MLMHWIKSFHLIAMVCWFSGLFYLPRLFVYHAEATDRISLERFKIMERRLYYYITTPAALLTIFFGFWLISFKHEAYSHMMWLHVKLILVAVLFLYHLYLGVCVTAFKHNKNKHSQRFYRITNEVPTLLLIAIIILAVVKPF